MADAARAAVDHDRHARRTPTRSGCRQKSPRPGYTCTCRSMSPGVTSSPVTSTTGEVGVGGGQVRADGLDHARRGSPRRRSRRVWTAGSMTRPPVSTDSTCQTGCRTRLRPIVRRVTAPSPFLTAPDRSGRQTGAWSRSERRGGGPSMLARAPAAVERPVLHHGPAGAPRCGGRRPGRSAATPRSGRRGRRRTARPRAASTPGRRRRPPTAGRSRPRARGSRRQPRVAISSAVRAPIAAGPCRSLPSSMALRASIHSDARVGRRRAVAAEPDRHARGPQLGDRRECAAPPIIMFELGQCATPAPRRRRGGRSRPRSGRCSARPTSGRSSSPTVLEVLDGAAPELLGRERVLVGVLGQVGVQPDVEPLGQLGRRRPSARA